MKLDNLVKVLDDCCNDITFTYNGKSSGIIPEVDNYIKTYHVWHGKYEKDYASVKEIIEDRIYDGNTLEEICDKIDFSIE